ncbi:glycosyltransferase family 4 protein [Bacillaceae bacterium OS4b]|nr:glycosyltransferase family 4 protein [Bacillaceae bacterium OS4b]
MKKSINIIHSLYYPDIVGGAEISTKILAESLNDIVDVQVTTVGKQKKGLIIEEVDNVKVTRLPYNNLFWFADANTKSKPSKLLWHMINTFNIKQYFALKKVLVESKPMVIHTQNLSGLSVAVWKLAYELNIPVVHTLRDYSLIRPFDSSFFSFFFQIITRHFSKYVSSVIGISEHILNKYVEKGFFENSSKYVIPNVVVGSNFEAKKINYNSPLIIGYFGQLASNKGVEYLINAIKDLPNNIVSKLYVCGDGPLIESLTQLANGDNRIVFTGKLKHGEVKDYMRLVDLTIMPSVWEEPFGRVIIESYQTGTPVFASNVGGIPEIIINPKNHCFSPESSEEIRKCIEAYYKSSDSYKEKLHIDCIDTSKKYNVDNSVSNHLKIYNKYYKS